MARKGLLAWTLWLRAGSRVWFDSHGIFKISQLHVKQKKIFCPNVRKRKISQHGARMSTVISCGWASPGPNVVGQFATVLTTPNCLTPGRCLCSCASLTPAVGNIVNWEHGI